MDDLRAHSNVEARENKREKLASACRGARLSGRRDDEATAIGCHPTQDMGPSATCGSTDELEG